MNDYNNKRSRMVAQSVSQLFEETVLSHAYKDDPYFRKFHMSSTFLPKPRNKISHPAAGGKFYPQQMPSSSEHTYYSDQDFEGNEDSCKNNNTESDHWSQKWGWWNPPRDKWLIFAFFQQSSMHGLKFIAQPRRHLTERIFWAIAFLAATITSGILIASVWERYKETPVIVTFDSNELEINSIPFPAVTICNMNMISKDVLKNIFDRYMKNRTEDKRQEYLTNLQYFKSLCHSSATFAKRYHFAANRGHVSVEYDTSLFNDTHGNQRGNAVAAGSGILPFLYKEAPSCAEMILKCIWAGVVTDCGVLFRPHLNEYGKCCTFNRLPSALLYSEKLRKRDHGGNSTSRWSREEVEGWKKWNYKEGFLLPEEAKYPERQIRAGSRFGLSILLDPHLDSYYCPVSDSHGFRIGLSNPLEKADIQNVGLGVGLDQEIFMRIHPELTIAEPNIRQFDFTKRQCLFGNEVQLDYFQPYAADNCIVECTSKILEKNCSCVPYLLPRSPSMRICSPSHKDRRCFRRTRRNLNRDVANFCGHCHSLCSKLDYRYKVSAAKLQHKSKLWFDHSDQITLPHWHEHKMSVVHIYFGKQEFVPLLRSELYGVRDLIANTGNILCLCLGFSVLSAVEILFFITCRPCWEHVRKNRNGNGGDTDTPVTGPTTDSNTNFHQNGSNRNWKFTKLMRVRNGTLNPSRSRNESKIVQVTSASLLVMNENTLISRHRLNPPKHPFSYSNASCRKEK